MATLREYFDADFGNTARVHVKIRGQGADFISVILYDFSAYIVFFASYVPGAQHPLQQFLQLIEAIQPGKTEVTFDDKMYLPSARTFPGMLEVRNTNPFELRAKFFGDPEWISGNEIKASTRLFIYSETRLSETDIWQIKQKGKESGLQVQFRSSDYAEERSKQETPLAFISHDTRDKLDVARKIAIGLQKRMCPVWYDEFSLPVGANLRDSIESGLKKCKKCVLILSPNFFANGGWTKKEFDSIFMREILEERPFVLPVWYGVSKEAVYDYSPSLLNIKGVDWQLGEEEVCNRLSRVILGQDR
jgi:hypothetical protein